MLCGVWFSLLFSYRERCVDVLSQSAHVLQFARIYKILHNATNRDRCIMRCLALRWYSHCTRFIDACLPFSCANTYKKKRSKKHTYTYIFCMHCTHIFQCDNGELVRAEVQIGKQSHYEISIRTQLYHLSWFFKELIECMWWQLFYRCNCSARNRFWYERVQKSHYCSAIGFALIICLFVCLFVGFWKNCLRR